MSELIFDAILYVFIALLAMPFLAFAASAFRLIRVGRAEWMLMLPGALLGLVVFDVMLFGSWGAKHIWDFPAKFIAYAGWIFFIPVFVVLLFLHSKALTGIIARTWPNDNSSNS